MRAHFQLKLADALVSSIYATGYDYVSEVCYVFRYRCKEGASEVSSLLVYYYGENSGNTLTPPINTSMLKYIADQAHSGHEFLYTFFANIEGLD